MIYDIHSITQSSQGYVCLLVLNEMLPFGLDILLVL